MRKKIKYQGGITKILCQKQAVRNKKLFLDNLSKIEISKSSKLARVNFEVISFSGAAGFEDQIISIYSFLFYAGTPIKWVIYSDGSYTADQKDILKELFAFVSVIEWDVYSHVADNAALSAYLKECHLAKKVNIILGHDYQHQTIYLDSDIIFYKNISTYLSHHLLSEGLWYAPDALGDIAQKFETNRESIYALNSGLLILNNHFNKKDVLDYFEGLQGNYHYFSEQSSFEFAFRKQRANILDPRQFVVDSSDQFDFSPKYYPDEIAMRHYTTPVRHKMWQKGWQWHFKA